MDVNVHTQKYDQFRAFYVFFIIGSVQIGVGVIGAPRLIFEKAGHDAWISILLSFIFVLIVAFAMLYILRQYENADILGIQYDLFGGFINKLFGTIYIIHFATEIFSILITYIEIIKVFIFPDSSSLILGTMLLILIIYSCLGGLRVIVGVTFLFFFLSHWIIFLLPEAMTKMNFFNFLPVMDRGIIDIIEGAKSTAYTFMGFEILFFLYPFIQNKENIRKPFVLALFYSAFFVLLVTVVTIGFFSAEQIQRRIWPVFHLFKIQTSPLIERFDYIVVAEWMMMTIPTMVLLMWGITYTAQRLYKIPNKVSLYGTSVLLLILLPFFTTRNQINSFTDIVQQSGIWITYIYPLILVPLIWIKKKRRKKKKGSLNHANE